LIRGLFFLSLSLCCYFKNPVGYKSQYYNYHPHQNMAVIVVLVRVVVH